MEAFAPSLFVPLYSSAHAAILLVCDAHMGRGGGTAEDEEEVEAVAAGASGWGTAGAGVQPEASAEASAKGTAGWVGGLVATGSLSRVGLGEGGGGI